jgi:predicted component of type VI protein secretion system
MLNAVKIAGLCLLGLMDSATIARAQPQASAPTMEATTEATAPHRKGIRLPTFKLEPWNETATTPTTSDQTSGKKRSLLPGLKLEPWKQKPEVEPAKSAVVATKSKKKQLVGSFKREPQPDKNNDDVQTGGSHDQVVDGENKAILFSDFKLEPWR